MGMFDTVLLRCPRCASVHEEQSKGGECVLADYELHEAPPDVLADVVSRSPFLCESCGAGFRIILIAQCVVSS